jgi:hypothetical protein
VCDVVKTLKAKMIPRRVGAKSFEIAGYMLVAPLDRIDIAAMKDPTAAFAVIGVSPAYILAFVSRWACWR